MTKVTTEKNDKLGEIVIIEDDKTFMAYVKERPKIRVSESSKQRVINELKRVYKRMGETD